MMKEKNLKKTFGIRVRFLRKLAGISQEKLAERAGLSTKTISYIENGKNTISFNKLPLIAEALNVPVYKLFVNVDDENNLEALNELLKTANQKEINAITEVVRTMLALR